MTNVPEVGDWIYVPSAFYLSHGIDDFVGGKALVVDVRNKHNKHWIVVNERRTCEYAWEGYLADAQDKLRERFDEKHAYKDPDYSPEFNEW